MKSVSRYSLDSSAISLVSYDEDLRHLEITFRRGGVQVYTGVPRFCLAELLSAKSKSAYIRDHIAPKFLLLRVPASHASLELIPAQAPVPTAVSAPPETAPSETLFDFLPADSAPFFQSLLDETPVSIKVVRQRVTKHGDFTFNTAKKRAEITMSRTVNKAQFALTLVHEIAHAKVYFEHGRRAAPHGGEWKDQYAALLQQACIKEVFPADLRPLILNHASSPLSTTARDVALTLALERHAPSSGQPLVVDLPRGARFQMRGLTLIKGRPLRKFFECTTPEGKRYRVSAAARIDLIEQGS